MHGVGAGREKGHAPSHVPHMEVLRKKEAMLAENMPLGHMFMCVCTVV